MPKERKLYEPYPTEQRSVVIKVPFNQVTDGKETFDTLVITAVIRNNGSITLLNNTGSNIFDFRSVRGEFLNAFIIALTHLSQYQPLQEQAG